MDEDDKEEERVRIKYEVGRLASDLHSEKRGRERLLDRMAQIEKDLAKINDRLEHGKWTSQSIIQTIMAAATIISTLILIWK